MAQQDDTLRQTVEEAAKLLDVLVEPSEQSAATASVEKAARSLEDIAQAVAAPSATPLTSEPSKQQAAVESPVATPASSAPPSSQPIVVSALPESMRRDPVARAVAENAPPHIREQLERIAAAEQAVAGPPPPGAPPPPPTPPSTPSTPPPTPPRPAAAQAAQPAGARTVPTSGPVPPPITPPPPTPQQVRSATGRARRQRYAAARAARARDARRQRLIDRMRNRTLGGRAATIGQAAVDTLRNPAAIAQQLPRIATALGASSATAAGMAAAAGPASLMVFGAQAAQWGIRQAGHAAIETATPFTDAATRKVAAEGLDIATGVTPYMVPRLIKAVPEWTEALLESKRGIQLFSSALNQYYSEAHYRQIGRDIVSAQRTGPATAAMGQQYQDFLDSTQAIKDDLHTIVSGFMASLLPSLQALSYLGMLYMKVSGLSAIAEWWRSMVGKDTRLTPYKIFERATHRGDPGLRSHRPGVR